MDLCHCVQKSGKFSLLDHDRFMLTGDQLTDALQYYEAFRMYCSVPQSELFARGTPYTLYCQLRTPVHWGRVREDGNN